MLSVAKGVACFAYLSAARGRAGYAHVALGAAGVMVNLCRSCAPRGWKPLGIDFDLPRPRSAARFEETFGCPVRFVAPATMIWFAASLLEARQPTAAGARLLTIEDVARAKLEPAGRSDLRGVVMSQIWAQVLTGSVSLDSAARALDIAKRTLQRALRQEGTDFRSLVNAIRARRAMELLRRTGASVTAISTELGYSTSANFARAFRNATGLAPEEFRGQ